MATIVVGVDNSARASGVLAEAVALARPEDELLVLRAIGSLADLPAGVLTVSRDGLLQELTDVHQQQLDELVRPYRDDARLRAEIRHGEPWEALCDAARASGARLMVIGAHGHRALGRLLGTTASRVLERAPCTVVAVRALGAP